MAASVRAGLKKYLVRNIDFGQSVGLGVSHASQVAHFLFAEVWREPPFEALVT